MSIDGAQTMLNLNERMERISEAIGAWLQPGHPGLASAFEKSVKERLFSLEDMKHRLLAVRKSHTREELLKWVSRYESLSARTSVDGNDDRVLCFHAGNLPLAGLQDLIACAATGKKYIGKLSRKDPHLLESLIVELYDRGALNLVGRSTDLADLRDCRADRVLFSGAASSVGPLLERIRKEKLAREGASFLERTAHYSIAFIDSDKPQILEDLVESIFRYQGMGCRSTAVVIAPFELDEFKCTFTDYIEAWWTRNPPHGKPAPSLRLRYAYNRAAGHPQSWLDHFLIEETEQTPDQPRVIHWIRGDREKAVKFASNHKAGLQSIYLGDSGKPLRGLEDYCEPLEKAQEPAADWKPDGVDVIRWLLDPVP